MQLFDTSQLSQREREILEFALEGLTDQQIGNKLEISVSTVSSYWVRIRGKLGHFSRTEMVSRLLQQRAEAEIATLRNAVVRLKNDLRTNEQLRRYGESADLLSAICQCNPEAAVVLDQAGTVIFCNRRASELFGCAEEDLVGKSADDLLRPSNGAGHTQVFEEINKDGGSASKAGGHHLAYAQRSTGELVRVVLTCGSGPYGDGRIFVCVVRTFADEIQVLRDVADSLGSSN